MILTRYPGACHAPAFNLEAFPSTLAARELLAAYRSYDRLRDMYLLLWPFQLFIRRQWRQLNLHLLEARSNVRFWGGVI